jgi:hypothetical protein
MIILKFTLMHTKFDIFLHFNNRKKFVTFVTYLVIWVRCVSCEGWELRSWSCVKYKILCSFFQHKISFDLSENELFAMIFMIDEILHSLSTFFYNAKHMQFSHRKKVFIFYAIRINPIKQINAICWC